MVEVLVDVGPSIGVPALKGMFPTVVRSELGTLCRDYRRGLQIQATDDACHLTWPSPGRVFRHGRTTWTSDDLEAACCSANTFVRPWGDLGPSPDQRWDSRQPITVAHRAIFQKTLARMTTQTIIEWDLRPEDLTRRAVRAAVDRDATRQALVALGYLVIQKARISPPVVA